MTAAASAVLFRSESKGSGFHANEIKDETCSLIIQKLHNASYLLKISDILWILKASVYRQNPMKNFNSMDCRWVVETTVKIWEICGGEEILWVWLKMADREMQEFYPLDSCNTVI